MRRFAALYHGRRDVQGTESGGCLHHLLTWGHYRGHLQGRFGLGIYPLLDAGTCAWAAVDDDQGDLDRMLLLRRLLRDYGLSAVLLTSRARGYHLTAFFDGWASAAAVRAVLRALIVEAGLPAATEVYPRADQPGPSAVAPGGYLRLPYLGALADPQTRPQYPAIPGRRVALDPADPGRVLSLGEFLDLADASRIAPAVVEALAETVGASAPGRPALSVPGPPEMALALPADPAALGVSPEIAALIRTGDPGRRYRSRSEAQLAVACALLAAGQPDAVIAAVLTEPTYRISRRALEQSPARRADAIRRCLAKARARVATFPAVAAGSLTPTLHRRLLAAGLPVLAWPVLTEILVTTDRATGLSFATARSIAEKLNCARATIHRILRPLQEVGIVEAVPLPRASGQWKRVAFRVRVGGAPPPPPEKRRGAPESVREKESVAVVRHGGAMIAEFFGAYPVHRVSVVRHGAEGAAGEKR